MTRVRRRMRLCWRAPLSVALGAPRSRRRRTRRRSRPGPFPAVRRKEAPKASTVMPDSVVGAPRETTPRNPKPRPSDRSRSRSRARSRPPDAAAASRRSRRPVAVRSRRWPAIRRRRRRSRAADRRRHADRAAGASNGREDAAFAAFQRGHYLTAFKIATERVEQHDDVKAMALLGELYATGLGVMQDDDKAADWYRRAADRGDRDAMFALAMMRMAGRAGPVNREEAAKLLAAAARLKHPLASYNLAHALSRRPAVPAGFRARRASCSAIAAEAGSPEAQYALATLYKEGRGVTQGHRRVRRGCSTSRRSPTTPTRRSNMRSRCSTAPASPRTRKRPPASCCARRTRAARSRRTASPTSWRPAAACPPTRSRRSSGT